MMLDTLNLTKNLYFIGIALFLLLKLSFSYNETFKYPLFKKIWNVLFLVIITDPFWCIFGCFKSAYRLFISETPSLFLLDFHRLLLILWPLAVLPFMILCDQLMDTHWKPAKRHYIEGIVAIALSIYIAYALIQFPCTPEKPWAVLDPFSFLLIRLNIIGAHLITLFFGFKKLVTTPDLPLLIKQQAKIALVGILSPAVLIQPLWALRDFGILPTNNFTDSFLFFFHLILLTCVYYSIYALFNLRLFNAYPSVQKFWQKDLVTPLSEVSLEIRNAIALSELKATTKAFFAKTYGFEGTCIKLCIRPTNHERNIEATKAVDIAPQVEKLLWIEDVDPTKKTATALYEKIKEKRIILRSEVQYNEMYGLDSEDAPILRSFMDEIKAELFIPIYGKKTLVGYVIVENNRYQDNPLISQPEIASMLTFTSHLAHAIEQMQQMDPDVLEKESATHHYQAIKLFQEREHCYEGIHQLLQAQSSDTVSLIYTKHKTIYTANALGAQLLDLPEGSRIINNQHQEPIRQLLHEFERYHKDRSIVVKDHEGQPLRFSVTRNTKKSEGVIIISRPALASTWDFPPTISLRNNEEWGYALFLQLTESGKKIETFLPTTQGTLLDFKIKFLRAVFSRRPFVLIGADEDIQKLALIAHQICSHSSFQKIIVDMPESNNEIALQLFGDPMTGDEGSLASLNVSGTLLIQNIELLAPKTQHMLTHFFATGYFSSLFSKQQAASNVNIICSSNTDLLTLVNAGSFSAKLYEQFASNFIKIPPVTTIPLEQLIPMAEAIYKQALSELPQNIVRVMNIEQLSGIVRSPSLPRSFCELHVRIQKQVDIQRRVIAAQVPQTDRSQLLIAQARKQGKALLKNEQQFRALLEKVPNYAQIAEFLDVDRTTVYRACLKYGISIKSNKGQRYQANSPRI